MIDLSDGLINCGVNKRRHSLRGISVHGINFNGPVRLDEAVAVAVGYIVRHQKLPFRIDVAVATVGDTVRSPQLVMELAVGASFFVAVVVGT